MKLIAGLGNPGEKYEKTRHNLGFTVMDKFLQDFESVGETVWKKSTKFKSDIAQIEWKPKVGPLEKVILAKPLTYMNNSGMAVGLLVDFYHIKTEDIWVVYDELDLPLGTLRMRFGGAAAGHHGVESIMERLGTDKFWRFRLGIGAVHAHARREAREGGEDMKVGKQVVAKANDFVLGIFARDEQSKLKVLVKNATRAIESALEHGLEKAMNSYNTK